MTPGNLRRYRRRAAPFVAALLALCTVAGCAPSTDPPLADLTLVFDSDVASPDFGTVALRGFSAGDLERLGAAAFGRDDWVRLFALFTGRPEIAGGRLPRPDDHAPMLGAWEIEREAVRFRPRFPLVAGSTYTALVDVAALERTLGRGSASGSATLSLAATMPRPGAEPAAGPPRVLAISPPGPTVPANLLRIYVSFSQPMHGRGIADHVELVDLATGEPIDDAFVEVPDGLWSPDRRRLTLFVHPGRVKRGVGPNRTLGPVLREGGRYRLRVDGALEDALGRPLAAAVELDLLAGPADRASPDPGAWRVRLPESAAGPLEVVFDEPLDAALASRLLQVVRESDGAVLEGMKGVGEDGRTWSFRPRQDWAPGSYRIEIDPRIEDLAGNRLGRLFEEEEVPPASRSRESGAALPFEVPASTDPSSVRPSVPRT